MPVRSITKLLTCLVLAILLAGTFLLIGVPPRPSWISEQAVFACAFLGLVIPLIWLPIWAWREKRRLSAPQSENIIQRLRDGIAFLTAFGISTFGWKKIMHLQFRVPMSFADRPASQLDGETLTWFYFGHSYTFACIVGILQITGAILLLVRRTRLTGAILLFPVMLNILLINIFYEMNPGALLQSVTLTMGVAYIIGIYTPQLLKLLFTSNPSTARNHTSSRWIAPAATAALSFLYVHNLSSQTPRRSPLYGRYIVGQLWVNGVKIQQPTNTTALTKLYFDLDNVCVLEYNDQQHRLIARYSYTEKPAITIESQFTDKSKQIRFHADVGIKDNNQLSLRGQLAEDSIAMILQKF